MKKRLTKKDSLINRRINDSRELAETQKLRLTKNHTRRICHLYSNNILSAGPNVGFAPKDENKILFELTNETKDINVNEPVQFVPVTELTDKGIIRYSLEEYTELDNVQLDAKQSTAAIEEVIPEEFGGESPFVGVSARTGEGIQELLQIIASLLPEPNVEIAALIPYDRGDLVSRLHLNSRIMVLDYREEGTFVRAMVKPEMAAELSDYRVVV